MPGISSNDSELRPFIFAKNNMVVPRWKSLLKGLGMIVSLTLVVYWLWFAIRSFPWIIIADGLDPDWEAMREHAAFAGFGMGGISFGTAICFGIPPTRARPLMLLALLFGSAMAAVWIFPNPPGLGLSSIRCLVYSLNTALIAGFLIRETAFASASQAGPTIFP